MGKAKGLSRKIVFDLINFSPNAGFVIDPEGNVHAWNTAMEQLTGVSSQTLLDKGDFVYAEPLFGRRQKCVSMGAIQMNTKYLEGAIEAFKMMVNVLPNNMDSWNYIGICLKELGTLEESQSFILTGPGISSSGKKIRPSPENVASACEDTDITDRPFYSDYACSHALILL
ncbi:PAS domain S-box protein [Methanoregula sp.]|uniref:tetratricopeptide repeat protein n=1 Tax=Methanoregula sp. TaxID=2052170 RepID=UPI003BAF18E8